MSLKKIIDWNISASKNTINGVIDSPFRIKQDQSGNADSWVYVCDVKIGVDEMLYNVPVSGNNREIFYSQMGKPVELTKEDGKWSVTGLSKVTFDFSHILYIDFTDDIVSIASEDWTGHITRPLTYGEIGSIPPAGYGVLPYGILGRFTRAGIFLEYVGY